MTKSMLSIVCALLLGACAGTTGQGPTSESSLGTGMSGSTRGASGASGSPYQTGGGMGSDPSSNTQPSTTPIPDPVITPSQ